MESPEFMLKKLRIDKLLEKLPAETQRALEIARNSAKNRNKIGLMELFIGVSQEINPLEAKNILHTKNIDIDDLRKQLIDHAQLEREYGDWANPDPNQPWDLTPLSENALSHARNNAKERHPNINPPIITPYDLFRGLIKVVLNK